MFIDSKPCIINRSVYLNPEPKTFQDALANLHAFSDEGRRKQRFRDLAGAIPYTSTPRLRECFGWMMVSGMELLALPMGIRPPRVKLGGQVHEILPTQEYYAIVYEWIPESESVMDKDIVQSQLDFFWLVGFCFVPIRLENWVRPGVLIDTADLICPWHIGWFLPWYKRYIVKELSTG